MNQSIILIMLPLLHKVLFSLKSVNWAKFILINLFFVCFISIKVYAQIEEVVVTATKTGETVLQETPISISAFDDETLSKTGISDVNELQALVPTLNVENNSSGIQVFMRGVGTNLVFAGNDPSTTINFDGVYIGRPFGSLFDFTDIERIEVLRGPQGTIWGRNAIGGTINIITKLPKYDWSYRLRSEIGNLDLFTGNGYLTGPIIDDVLAFSISGRYTDHDGFIDNIYPGGEDIQAVQRDSYKASLLFEPSDEIQLIARADYNRIKDDWGTYSVLLESTTPTLGMLGIQTPLANSVIGDFSKAAANRNNDIESELWGTSLEAKFVLNEYVSIRSLSAFRSTDHTVHIDFDASEAEFGFTSPFITEADQWSQEINLSFGFERINGVLGAYYYDEDAFEFFNIQILGDNVISLSPLLGGTVGVLFGPNQVITRSWAVFAQGTYDLSEKVALTLGLRYTDDQKDISGNAIIGGAKFLYKDVFEDQAVTPKFGIEFRPNDSMMLYGSISRGYKSGGFSTPTGSADKYDSESMWAYEFGLKSDWYNNRLRVNATTFYYDYSDLQIQRIVQTSTDIDNAEKAEVFGLELEIVTQPFPGLEVSLNTAYLDAEYDKFTEAVDDSNGLQFDASGQKLSNAPEFSLVGSAQYTHYFTDGSWGYVRVDGSWNDDINFAPNNEPLLSQEAYGLLNASIGYEKQIFDHLVSAQLFVNNLQDTEYLTGAERFIAAGFPAQGFPGAPRTFGIRLSIEH